MKKILISIIAAPVFLLAAFCHVFDPGLHVKMDDISVFIEKEMIEYNVPGVSIAVISNYEIDWAKGYGVADIETNEPVTETTLFQAASISKPVTAMAALRFVMDGEIQLKENINNYLTNWKIPDNEFTQNKKVTLKNILSHTGGITVNGFRGYKKSEGIPTLLQILDGLTPANSAPIRVDTEPGKKYRYSGGGYTIIQQALIDITQMPFPEIMHEAVLSRIGMDYSTYEQPLPESLLQFAAAGHRSSGESVKEKRHIYPEMAAAGLWTTPGDLAKFAIEIQKSLKSKSNKVLSREMTELMVTPYISDNYGLGLRISERAGKPFFRHTGGNEGFKCLLSASLDTGVGVIIMTNGDMGVPLCNDIVEKIEKLYKW